MRTEEKARTANRVPQTQVGQILARFGKTDVLAEDAAKLVRQAKWQWIEA